MATQLIATDKRAKLARQQLRAAQRNLTALRKEISNEPYSQREVVTVQRWRSAVCAQLDAIALAASRAAYDLEGLTT